MIVVPITDLLWGLLAFALGWLAINFAEAYEQVAVNVRCACGRREMRDVLCDPQDRVTLAGELTKACPWCGVRSEPVAQATGPAPSVPSSLRGSVPRLDIGDHDAED